MNRLQNKNGSALIALTVISMLLCSVMLWYSHWSRSLIELDVHQAAQQRAVNYADSGIYAAMSNLRNPLSNGQLLPGATRQIDIPLENGRVSVALYRSNLGDSSLVDAYSTAYYYLQKGSSVDSLNPGNPRQGQLAVIYAKIRLSYAGEFFAVVPGQLRIAYGSDISLGTIYARELTFDSGSSLLPKTRVGAARYLTHVYPEAAPSFVTFTPPSVGAVPVTVEPSFTRIDAAVRELYQRAATADGTVLAAGSTISGSYPAPGKVYFVNGDVHIGKGTLTGDEALQLTGPYVIYASGRAFIHNSILQSGGTWLGLMAENGIRITTDAPDTLSLTATMICNGTIQSDGNERPEGDLSFAGGFFADGVDFSSVWRKARTYKYMPADASMPLPYFPSIEEYKIVRGRYSR